MRRFPLIFALIAAFVAVPLAFAASNSADVAHLHVQLVVPNQNLKAGTPANAGLYFKLEPGWHVYWQNAGDSGEPPHIQWTLPAGITASAMQFPAPQRLPLGPLMDFGYENEVLFPFKVRLQRMRSGALPFCTQRLTGWCAARFVSRARRSWTRTSMWSSGRASGKPDLCK